MTKKRIVKLLSIALSLAMLISCIPLSTFAAGTNFDKAALVNGGFETGTTEGFYFRDSTKVYSINSDPANVYEGNYSLKLDDFTAEDGVVTDAKYKRFGQVVTLEENTDYVFSFYQKTSDQGNLSIEITTNEWGTPFVSTMPTKKATLGEWAYFEVAFNSGDKTRAIIMLHTFKDNIAYLDNFALIKAADIKTEAGLITNGDFEAGNFTGYMNQNSTFSLTTEHARSGHYSLKLQPSNSAGTIMQTVSGLEPNTDYVVTYYEYNDQNYVFCGVMNTSYQNFTLSDKSFEKFNHNNIGWRRNRFTFNTGDKTTVYIFLRNIKPVDSGCVAYVDDICINKLTAEHANIVDNGGFESGSAKDGWAFGSAYSDKFAINTDKTYVKSGDYSLKMVGLDGWVRMKQTMIPIKENTDYVLSYWAYDGTGNATCEIQSFYDYSNTNPKTFGVATKAGWKKNVIEFNSGNWNLININFYNNGNSNRTIYIDDMYLAEKVEVYAEAGENGVAEVDSEAVAYGDTATFTATPDNGYAFDAWYNGEEKVSDNAIYEAVITEETYLTAQFKAVKTVAINNADFETAPTNSFTTDFGYHFGNAINDSYDYLSITDKEAFTGNQSLQVGNAESSAYGQTLYSCFVAIPISLTEGVEYTLRFWSKSATPSGTACVRVTGYYWGGTNVSGDFNAATDGNWTVNIRKFTVAKTGTYYLMFMAGKDITYIDDIAISTTENITVNTTAGGTVTKTNQYGQSSNYANFEYLFGDTVTLTAKPDYCHKFAGWYVGDELVSTDAKYTFKVEGAATYEAKFESDGKGDFDGNEFLDADDLVVMIDIVLGKTSEYDVEAADLNGDGKVNLLDLVNLKKRIAAGIQGETF